MKDKMICPKAKECDRECTDKKSHPKSKGCRDKRLYPTFSDGSVCPACIPYEPDTCPADLQPEKHCTHPFKCPVGIEVAGENCTGDVWSNGRCKYLSPSWQPTPTMPLRDKTFRQTVEEILSSTECEDDGRICSDMTLDKYEERPSCEQCRTDRICEAVLKMAEGMPKTQCVCQSWIREQIK